MTMTTAAMRAQTMVDPIANFVLFNMILCLFPTFYFMTGRKYKLFRFADILFQ